MTTTPTLMQQNRVRVADIVIGTRLRPVSEAGVQSLIASVTETGVMKDAIHLRKKKDGRLHLLAGAHRVEMATRLGWEEIEAKVWTGVTDDWARLIEIDDNLAGAEMNVLDTAVFLATRKEIYERLHPETRRGVAGGLARQDSASDIVSFAESAAEKLGCSKRHVERMVAAGARLHPDQVAALRSAPRAVTLKDLTEIGKIATPTDRYAVVDRLAAGRAKSAADALRTLRLEDGRAPVADAAALADRAFRDLMAAWKRAPAAARHRFRAEIGHDDDVERGEE